MSERLRGYGVTDAQMLDAQFDAAAELAVAPAPTAAAARPPPRAMPAAEGMAVCRVGATGLRSLVRTLAYGMPSHRLA